MTILPNNKRSTGTNSKEGEKSEASNNTTNHNNPTRHNRSLLNTSQLLMQDAAPVGSPLQNHTHSHTSYNEDIPKFRSAHVGHLFKEEQAPSSPGSGRPCRTYSRERASKRKNRDHLEHSSSSKTNVPPNLTYPQTDDTERNNSEDEYEPVKISTEEWEDRDRNFKDLMRKKGFVVKNIVEDGACLFRAIADQVYGNEDMHSIVRNNCMDYIMQNRDFFSEYITEDINRYVSRKRNDFVHGNHLEIQALSEMYNRTIEVYCYSEEPINIFHGHYKQDYEPIRLSYQRGSHYNSIIDPYSATIGVGLGLPNYHPGEADRKLLKDATQDSELTLIEQTMIEDKIAATDWEATNDAILEQAARESWALYVNDGHLRDPLAGCSSTSEGNHSGANTSTAGSTSRSTARATLSQQSNSRLSSFQLIHNNQRERDRCATFTTRIPTPPQRLPSPSNSRLTSTTTSSTLRLTSSGHRISTPPHSSSRSCHSLPTSPHASPRVTSHSTSTNVCPSWPSSPRLQIHTSTSTPPNSPHLSPRQSSVHSKAAPSTSTKDNDNDDSTQTCDNKDFNSIAEAWNQFNNQLLMSQTKESDENLCMQMPPEVFGMSHWGEDADVLARVLAESQKEYLESLKIARQTQQSSSLSDWNDVDKPGPSYKST